MPEHQSSARPTVLTAAVITDAAVQGATLAVLPVGSFEQHGPHLPLVTDTLVAAAIAAAIAETRPMLQLPPITVSCSHEHAGFRGTVSISMTTLAAVIADIAGSLHRQQVDRLVVVNGHGGNYGLANLVQQSATGPVRMALFPAREDWDDARRAAGIMTSGHEDMHAGELETSILLATHPEVVRDGWQHADHTHDDRRHLATLGMTAYTTSGVIGRPSAATSDKGRAVLRQLAQNAAETIRMLEEADKQH